MENIVFISHIDSPMFLISKKCASHIIAEKHQMKINSLNEQNHTYQNILDQTRAFKDPL